MQYASDSVWHVVLTVNRVQCGLLIVGIEIAQGLADHQTQFDLVV
jgi:hypothetical protein